jgi:outer membrane protein assembly factor BamB
MAVRTELVELVEDDEPGRGTSDSPHGDEPLPPDSVERSRAWLRRHWRWLAPTVALVVAALVGTQTIADARERARLDRLAAIPGVLAPVSPHLRVLWRGQQEVGSLVQSGAWVQDMLIGGLQGRGNRFAIAAVDAGTGKRVWTTAVKPPQDIVAPNDSTSQTYVGCFVVPRDETEALRPRLSDWVSSTTRLPARQVLATCVGQQQGGSVDGPADLSLWVLDPSNGKLVSSRVLPGQAQLTILGNDLVSAMPANGIWHVAATDLATGATTWRLDTAPEAAPNADAAAAARGLDTTMSLVTTRSGHLILVTPAGHLTEIDATGRTVRTRTVEPQSYVTETRAGGLLAEVYTSGAPAGTLLLRSGREVSVHDGPLYLTVDDGTAPDVILLSDVDQTGTDRGITALSATTGRTLWTHTGDVQTSLLLAGTLYLAESDAIVALDARTGAQRWANQVDFAAQDIGTDGASLLVAEPGSRLAAYALGTGAQQWTQKLGQAVSGDAPAWTVQNLDLTGGKRHVIGFTDDGGVAVLG